MDAMDFYKYFFVTVGLSMPIVILIGLGRAVLCIFRSVKAKQLKLTIFSSLGIVILLVIFSAIVVVWFAYGVGHSGKSISTELILLASTCASVFVGVYGIWKLSLYIERRL